MERKKRYIKQIAALVLSGILFSGVRSVSAEEENRDYTDLQWYYNSETGVSFPGWNTYDETGAPIHNVDPSKEIVVAVVDSGVDYTHEDLRNVMWDKGLEYPELTALGGGKYGINTLPYGDSTNPMDDAGHGSHVAGIIAAEWNHTGVSGALSGVKIMAVRATGDNTICVKKGLEYVLAAKRAGVNIAAVNLSWNGSVSYSGPELFNQVVQELAEENVILVFSAGNQFTNLDNDMAVSTFQRAKPSVITVAASEKSGGLAGFSNYGSHYCDFIAPGDEILSTIPNLPAAEENLFAEGNGEEEGTGLGEPLSEESGEEGTGPEEPLNEEFEEEELPSFADPYYGYKSGTSMSAPIVTAEAAYLYSLYPNMSAEERAAHVVNSSVLKNIYEGKLYGGFADVQAAASLSGWPYVSDAKYDFKKGILTMNGYDFGPDAGTIEIDGTEYTPERWSDQKITVRAKNIAMGVHTITVQNHKASKSRYVNVTAENEDLTIRDFEVHPVIPYSMTRIGDEIHIAADESDDGSVLGFYRLKKGASAFEKIGGTAYFSAKSAATWNGLVCYVYNTDLITMEPDGKNMTQTKIQFPQEYIGDVKIYGTDDRLFAAWPSGSSFYIGEYDLDAKTVRQLLEIPNGSYQCIGLAKEDSVITAALIDQSDYNHLHIDVIRFRIGEESHETIFQVNASSMDAFDHVKAVFVNDRMYLGGVAECDAENSWNYSLLGYTLEGEEVMYETIGGGHLHCFDMAASKDELVLFGSADAWKNNLFILNYKISEEPAPTITPKPTREPEEDDEPKKEETPAPYYPVTCQDAGYPQGWYWDETKRACVAPAPAATVRPSNPGGNTPSVTPPASGTGPLAPATTAPGVTPSASPKSGEGSTPGADITPIPAKTPSASVAPTPPSSEKKEPAKRSLWYLVEPAVMLIAGLAMWLVKDKKAIPWIIGADAVIGILAAVLDQSVLSWILLILNIAAVGLIGLYKGSAKK